MTLRIVGLLLAISLGLLANDRDRELENDYRLLIEGTTAWVIKDDYSLVRHTARLLNETPEEAAQGYAAQGCLYLLHFPTRVPEAVKVVKLAAALDKKRYVVLTGYKSQMVGVCDIAGGPEGRKQEATFREKRFYSPKEIPGAKPHSDFENQ